MKMTGMFVAALVLAFPMFAFAHGGGMHVMGTVKAIDDKTLTVETKQNKEVKVGIDDKTKFEKGGAVASIKDVVAGERVVVHTAKPDKTGALTAALVKFGQSPTGAAHPAGHSEHGGDHAGHAGHAEKKAQ